MTRVDLLKGAEGRIIARAGDGKMTVHFLRKPYPLNCGPAKFPPRTATTHHLIEHMPATLTHPADPAITLSATRPPFGEWRLKVNGKLAAENEDADGFNVRLTDGSVSNVIIGGRRFDPLPVFTIDGVDHPTGASLGVVGVIAVLLPLVGVLLGPVGLLVGLIGMVVTLHVARSRGNALVRLVSGVGFAFLAYGVALWAYLEFGEGRALRPAEVHVAVLPAIPSIPDGGAARSALALLPDLPAAAPIPVGVDPIPPFSLAEVAALRASVLSGRFADAERVLHQLELDARADVRREGRWRAAYRMTFQAMPDSFTLMLDRWVAASPTAAEPLAARAWSRYWTAFYWRGEGAPPLGGDSRRGFTNALAHSVTDAGDALILDPDLLPAYWVLLFTARSEGDQETATGILTHALRRSPTSFDTYAVGMLSLVPEWGGSLEQMQQLADAAAPLVPQNPDLRRILAYPRWKRGDLQVESPTGSGLDDDRAALEFGRDPLFMETLGHALWHSGRAVEGLAWVDSSLALEPTNHQAILTRAKIRVALLERADDAATRAAKNADMRTLLSLRPLMEP